MDRRQFLATSAAATLAAVSPRAFAGASSQRKVALIGSGWYGKVDLLRLIQVEPVEVVALADVDSKMLEEAAGIVAGRQKSGNTPQTYGDYRRIFEDHEPDLVLVDTPDHWHALPMIDACKAGADVYVQKPIGVDVAEGAAMLKTARETGRVVQVGMQRRSTPHLMEAKKRVVEAGLLGEVAHAQVCCYYHMRAGNQANPTEPPGHIDWAAYNGPAGDAPYMDWVHPRKWRAFMRYGNGIVGDMCVHMLDLTRWMLGLGWPDRVGSTGGIFVQTDAASDITDTQSAEFSFPGERGDGSHFRGPRMNVVWNHRSWGDAVDPEWPWASIIYGSKGTLKLDVNKYRFEPRGGGEVLEGTALREEDKYPEDATEKDLERHVASAVREHMRDWLRCVDDRSRPVADIEEGHISAAACILANNALKLGRSLDWDPAAGECVDDAEANALLQRAYADGYTHPADA